MNFNEERLWWKRKLRGEVAGRYYDVGRNKKKPFYPWSSSTGEKRQETIHISQFTASHWLGCNVYHCFNLPQILFLTPQHKHIISQQKPPLPLFMDQKGPVRTMPCLCPSAKAQWGGVAQACALPSFLLFTLKLFATLCWDGCCAWIFWRRKWRIGTNTSVVSSILFLSLSPNISMNTTEFNLYCL